MLDLVQWIRQINQGRQPDQKVRLLGMDITAPALGVQEVLDKLETAEVDMTLDGQSLGLNLQQGDFWPGTWERYAALSDARRNELSDNYGKLNEILIGQRASLVAAFSENEYERMLLLGEIGKIGNDFFSSSSREAGGEIRERGMAQTILWILEHELAGEKAIIWSHNLHVAKSAFRMPGLANGALTPMGFHLSRSLEEAYISIGGAFGTGSYPANLPPGERLFDAVPEDVMDGALAEVGVPLFIVDLRGARQNPTVSSWLQQEREWKAQDSRALLVPSTAFDLVYYVNVISRSQPTPLALQRFQSLR
jgi:erythromycin esterase